MIAAMAKAPLPRFTESAINELFTERNLLVDAEHRACESLYVEAFKP